MGSTYHDKFARQDYERLRSRGIRVAREGLRWHLIERTPHQYDFSSALPILRAAQATDTRVIWDLCHFGWPDGIDVFTPDFVWRLASFGAAFARWLRNETREPGYFVPINEISFFSWICGDSGGFHPFAKDQGIPLKRNLVRAAIHAMDAIWAETSAARFVHVDPVINVVAHPKHPEERRAASAYNFAQYESWDMLCGRVHPELGGHEKYLDIIGVNYYRHNQWFYNREGSREIRKFQSLLPGNPHYRPFREMLREVHERYHRPFFIAETGAESRMRVNWLRYIASEAIAAIEGGVPVGGLCLYPILNHPGWVDDRHCPNGLWDYANENGEREIYKPLARELENWQRVFDPVKGPVGEANHHALSFAD